MFFLDSKINKCITAGMLPKEKLVRASRDEIRPIDIDSAARKGMEFLRKNHGLSSILVAILCKRVAELELLNNEEFFQQEINVLVNTLYDPDLVVNFINLYSDAELLIPAVTPIDKVLLCGAWAYYYMDSMGCITVEASNLKYAWVYLVRFIERKELQTGLTIDLDRCDLTRIDILELIMGDWGEKPRGVYIEITEKENIQLKSLSEKRKTIQSRIESAIDKEKIVSAETEDSWTVFLYVVNGLSSNENITLNTILNTYSSREKIAAINRYNSKLFELTKGKFVINHTEYDLLTVFKDTVRRFSDAPHYCYVSSEGVQPFVLNPAIAGIAMEPMTYNHLLIAFHYFRLSPNKESAKRFFGLALRAIQKNLCADIDFRYDSIDVIIDRFYSIVSAFVNENKKSIECLTYTEYQQSGISDGSILKTQYAQELDTEKMRTKIEDIQNSDKYDQMIEEALSSQMSIQQINSYIEQAENQTKESESIALAAQIIRSLNIIYIFCDALRISINNKHAMVKIQKKETAEKIRRELLKIDTWIVQQVYSGVDVLEYRETYGIDSRSLTESEQAEEKYKNEIFAYILKDSISELLNDIDNDSIDHIFATKKRIKEEIRQLPDCDEKDQYVDWLDEISNRISNALIAKVKKTKDDYDDQKNALIHSLGNCGNLLPEEVIDTLTTAELLYHRYASEEYNNQGFDYSSISALYYQSFETAYNRLIWQGYSDVLNNSFVGGRPFIEIILGKNAYDEFDKTKECHKYLGPKLKEVKKYIQYKSDKMGIKDNTFTPFCMYGLFYNLMKSINDMDMGTEFIKYIASIVHFSDDNEMLNDVTFMNKCRTFANDIERATPNRNRASHGGAYIDLSQCTTDKKTVLDNLEIIRADSMGLIEQLLGIMSYKV